jgi:cellulose synthase/poly-beta-1,6-N-acetylglucosamine synthase-like glycosyltransferase
MTETLFWLSAGILLYVYAGYPLLLWLIVRLRGARAVRTGATEPRVTLVISAYNEAAVIRQKLENVLALDYPPHLLEVVVVSDASSDGTDEIVASLGIAACAWRGRRSVGARPPG